jgi:hypothetical protein
MTLDAYPLHWPAGWKRTETHGRTTAKFSKGTSTTHRYSDGSTTTWRGKRDLTISESTARVLEQLRRMGLHDDDLVISTNLELRLDGLPRSNQREPEDPGAAVYWRDGEQMRCMAIDRYDRVADNLAAIAATLEAMRAIERHGGAEVLDRAYMGFAQLPPPIAGAEPWYSVLGVPRDASSTIVEKIYRDMRSQHHPDKGGDASQFDRVQKAWEQYQAEHSS